ncbi:hypothetical protein EON63_20645 [archaeon]|nr:MAG: hypothetical protein EON63_20645 [archaeon]
MFDTFVVDLTSHSMKAKEVQKRAVENHVNLRVIDDNRVRHMPIPVYPYSYTFTYPYPYP